VEWDSVRAENAFFRAKNLPFQPPQRPFRRDGGKRPPPKDGPCPCSACDLAAVVAGQRTSQPRPSGSAPPHWPFEQAASFAQARRADLASSCRRASHESCDALPLCSASLPACALFWAAADAFVRRPRDVAMSGGVGWRAVTPRGRTAFVHRLGSRATGQAQLLSLCGRLHSACRRVMLLRCREQLGRSTRACDAKTGTRGGLKWLRC